MPPSPTLLTPEVIARLKGLELRARTVVSGALTGVHRSAFRGYSIEFAEHRAYSPGDDIRHVDWRLFGRKDRLFIKQYEEDSTLSVCVAVDVSGSMTYGKPLSKFDYASTLAASIAWLVIRQQDAVGLLTFDEQVQAALPPSAGRSHLANLIRLLESAEPQHATDIAGPLVRLTGELRRRSIVFLFSDLLAPVDAVVRSVEQLAARGHEVVVMHVMDDDEWRLPLDDNTLFQHVEVDEELLADPLSLQRNYVAAVERFSLKVKTACLRLRCDYLRINTREPLDAVLVSYLARRRVRRGASA